MSYQAMGWAMGQDVGSPSARCVLMSIANYANDAWCAWPKQETLAREGVQSVDSVQRRMPELVDGGIVRRIKLKRFGRRIHDFYILAPSPYFSSSIEEIRPLLPSSCDVMEESERAAADCGSVEMDATSAPSEESEGDAAADCGSVQNPTLPQSAVDAAADCGSHKEPVKEPKTLSPTPSKREGVLEEMSEEAEKRFEVFKAGYPDGIVDLDSARLEFVGLPVADQRACVAAVPVYADRCRKRREKSMKAHLFVRKRGWDGLLASVQAKPDAPAHHLPASQAGRAILALGRIAHCRPFMLNDKIVFLGEVTPQLLALADVPPDAEWRRYEIGSPNFASWRDLIATAFKGRARPELTVIDAPWPWPPRKDGSINLGTTDPPRGLSDDDARALAGM